MLPAENRSLVRLVLGVCTDISHDQILERRRHRKRWEEITIQKEMAENHISWTDPFSLAVCAFVGLVSRV